MNQSKVTISVFKENIDNKNSRILEQVNEAKMRIHLKNIRANKTLSKINCRQGLCKILIQAVANTPNPGLVKCRKF